MADAGGSRYDWLECDCGVKWISGEVIVHVYSVAMSLKGSLVRESQPGQEGKNKVEFR